MKESEVNESVREYLAQIGAKGGSVKTTKGFGALEPEERKANAQKAAAARWAKTRAASLKKGKAKKGDGKGKKK